MCSSLISGRRKILPNTATFAPMLPKRYLLLPLTACLLAACRPSPQYQDHVTIPKYAWTYDFRPTFSFNITDTQAAYQLFFLIRHTDAYPYNNIWLMMDTKGPGDSTFTTHSRVELPLAD